MGINFLKISNALRNDLIHPNEYVRGSTLRFLCKVKIAELLEPLVPSIIKNLEHRFVYYKHYWKYELPTFLN